MSNFWISGTTNKERANTANELEALKVKKMEKMEEHGVSILHELLQWNKSCTRLLFCHDLKLNLSVLCPLIKGRGPDDKEVDGAEILFA